MNGIRGLAEADLRLHRGRVEVRHLKTLGPLPVLWDRWRIAPGWNARLSLGELLDSWPAGEGLMLDLKGSRRRLSELVVAELGRRLDDRPFAICARAQSLLEPFADLPVPRFCSLGSARQLRLFLQSPDSGRLDGVSIHERLLDAEVVRALKARTSLVLSWPVNRFDRAVELLGFGVDGLISDDVPAVAASVAGASA